MALSVVDLYRDVLPKTNCGDCGFATCIAFAGMVVSEKHPLENCPHLDPKVIEKCSIELNRQYDEGKWLKRDMAEDALAWARERSSSMEIPDLVDRIGGKLFQVDGDDVLELPYFNDSVLISKDRIVRKNGQKLTRWEQVFLYNHLAQGGSALPTGKWKGLVEIPNTVSKIKTMKEQIEQPIVKRFMGRPDELLKISKTLGGVPRTIDSGNADVSIYFRPLPKVPVMLLFWDEDKEDGFSAKAGLLFDETITGHLDIESIMFLSERIRQLVCRD